MNRVNPFSLRRTFVTATAAALLVCSPLVTQTARAAKNDAPTLEVDASWPQPLPNKWAIGAIAGVAIGPQDHVWIIHRPATLGPDEKHATTTPPNAECCIPAPPVIEFDAQGKVVQAWGGPGAGYEWFTNEHGIYVDYKGNVWVSGVAGKDWGKVLKFSPSGKFIMQIGRPLKPGETFSNAATDVLGRQPADMDVDPKTNELYIADGDGGAQRVLVFDAETGAFKRMWGAYGEKPQLDTPAKHDPDGPPSRAFSVAVHCVRLAKDGLVYVCDRNGDRVQVFHQDGKFVKEGLISPKTLGTGTAFDLDFTPDQRFFYVADGTNHKVWIMQRDSMEIVGSFGQLGHNAGEFRNVHALAVDSKGNLFTTEASENKRVQKFVPTKGTKRASR
jgi:sugar lactone lactonase YvrE